MRACVSAYSEKKTALVAADRRRTGNLMVASLEDLVTPQVLEDAGADVQVRRRRRCARWSLLCRYLLLRLQPADSEFLATVAVVIPKAAEEVFLETYAQVRPAAALPVHASLRFPATVHPSPSSSSATLTAGPGGRARGARERPRVAAVLARRAEVRRGRGGGARRGRNLPPR